MGISGDMNLAALLDLGVDKDYLLNELKKLNLQGYQIDIKKGMKNSISGTQVIVNVESEHHKTESDLSQHQHHHDAHRGMKEITQIIQRSSLSEKVKIKSLAMFQLIAITEAKIHNKPVEKIHFHEVGAIDSIIDIVGAAICLDYLNPDKIISSSVQLGSGFVKCAHGMFPVPAPATAEILKGKPVKTGAVQFETTTPTGAAILAVNVDEFAESTHFIIEKTGYGLGHKDSEIPNILRVYWINDENAIISFKTDTQRVIETNIDDMSSECYENVMENLFEAGALDVFLSPIVMKKSRPAVMLNAICSEDKTQNIIDIILRQTSSIGVRSYNVDKQILERKIEPVETPYGEVRIKLSGLKGDFFKAKPEYEDCLRIAKKTGQPLIEIIAEIQQIANNLLNQTLS